MARVGTEEAPAEPVVRSDERVALRFPHPLPAGPVTIRLEFRGTQFTQEDSGIFRQQSGSDWYSFTQFEADRRAAGLPLLRRARLRRCRGSSPSGARGPHRGLQHAGGDESGSRRGNEATSASRRPDRCRPTWSRSPSARSRSSRPDRGQEACPGRASSLPAARRHEAALGGTRVAGDPSRGSRTTSASPYPFEKLDIVAVPDFVASARWRTPGLITYPRDAAARRPRTRRVGRRAALRGRQRARARAPVVRRPGDHGVVGRHLAQRGLRHLDGAPRSIGQLAADVAHRPRARLEQRANGAMGATASPAPARSASRSTATTTSRTRSTASPTRRARRCSACSSTGSAPRTSAAASRRTSARTPTATPPRATSWPHLRRRRPRRRAGVRHLPRSAGRPAGAGQGALWGPGRVPGGLAGPVAPGGLHRRPRGGLADSGLHPLEHAREGAEPVRACSTGPGRR